MSESDHKITLGATIKTSRPKTRLLKTGLIGISMLALAACGQDITRQGYIPDTQSVSDIEIGIDNEASVQTLLGSPSHKAAFSLDQSSAWYYISTTLQQRAFLDPLPLERTILAVYFDDSNTVTDIRRYGLEDGRVVDFEGRTTPTTGKELGLLDQLFGNIGRFNNSGGAGGPGSPGPTPSGGGRGGQIPR